MLWKIPKYLLDKVQGKPRRDSQKRQAWSLTVDEGEEAGEVSWCDVAKRDGGGEERVEGDWIILSTSLYL